MIKGYDRLREGTEAPAAANDRVALPNIGIQKFMQSVKNWFETEDLTWPHHPDNLPMQFNIPQSSISPIKVIGVGGGGSNAVNTMFEQGITGVDFIVCHDAQAHDISPVPEKFNWARPSLKVRDHDQKSAKTPPLAGRGHVIVGVGHQYGLCDRQQGGGTRDRRCACVAQACKERGILTVGIVTVPFQFEGRRRNSSL